MLRGVHTKCRGEFYPFSEVKRFVLKDEDVPWTKVLDYNPPEYECAVLVGKPWADPPLSDKTFTPLWNQKDGKINRKSHTGDYKTQNNVPLNPEGRTGIRGRGLLGRWGPNHAADPIVTRWKLDEKEEKEISSLTKRPILQFCAIQRRDCSQWALPGGMVDSDELISETLLREFLEETTNSLQQNPEEVESNKKILKEFFQKGQSIFKGYVDDPRNTDNAWMETAAVNFHDETNSILGQISFEAGDDAKNVKWLDLEGKLDLYASHSEILRKVAELHKAHW